MPNNKTTSSPKRKSYLADLIGRMKAKATSENLEELKEVVDGMGVQRKEVAAKNEEVVAMAVAEALAAAGVEVTEELLQTILDGVMAGLEESAEVAEEVPAEERQGEDHEEEDEEEEKAFSEKRVNDLLDTIHATNEDMGEMAKSQVELVEVVKALVPVVAEMQEEQSALKALLKQAPRRASEDDGTVIEDEKAEKEAKKSLNGSGEKVWLGAKLKDD